MSLGTDLRQSDLIMPLETGSIALERRLIEKPWGRTELPSAFANTGGRRIGEVWFERSGTDADPLLAKYIFTSEKLSIQVHPDDAHARKLGLRSGKNECWYILDVDEDAKVGLGLTEQLSSDEICAAALNGSIERLIDWKPVAAGDFVYVPAGTIHAIGAGIVLFEFQQNVDVTYRLYDYGRPRELHLDDGLEVARPMYDAAAHFRQAGGPVNDVLLRGPEFTLVRADHTDGVPAALAERQRWVMPIEGAATSCGVSVKAGGCLLVQPGEPLEISPSSLILVGAEGPL